MPTSPIPKVSLPELSTFTRSQYEQRKLPIDYYDSRIFLTDILDYSRKYFPEQYVEKEGAQIPNTCIIAYLTGVRPIVLSEIPHKLPKNCFRNLMLQPVDGNTSWLGIRTVDILNVTQLLLPDVEKESIILNFRSPDIHLEIK